MRGRFFVKMLISRASAAKPAMSSPGKKDMTGFASDLTMG